VKIRIQACNSSYQIPSEKAVANLWTEFTALHR
jgi:hypothetical protein